MDRNFHVGTKSFGLSCEDVQDKDEWRIKGQPARPNPDLPGK